MDGCGAKSFLSRRHLHRSRDQFFTGVDGADNYLSIGEGSSPENGSSLIFNHSNIHYGVDFFMQRFYLQSESIWIQYRSYRIKMAFNISLSIVDKKDNCSENQFTCNDGNCIDNFGVETGYFDCFDGSDEDVYTDFVDCRDPFSSLFNGFLSDPDCLEWDDIALLRTRDTLPDNVRRPLRNLT
ncbi:hypothetical protein BSL78_23857 [Apostichopus japonicus]|uniref:Uncharacterized protein n=1 Tax=Stichopus japonicus TaxID=307972 RepID=A0A2G8JU69_STIJA|nr:hypothetical protein BSL78_23857 [Apostichopus japonicus]